MAYIPLSRKFYTPYKQIPNRLLKQESIKYKCFLDSISNYAISLNSGFDTLYLKKGRYMCHTPFKDVDRCLCQMLCYPFGRKA